jgi:hypothetical protein
MKDIRLSETDICMVYRGLTSPMRAEIKLKGKDAGDKWVKIEQKFCQQATCPESKQAY